MNNVLLRLPLAGSKVLEYNSGVRGHLAKTVNVVSHIALLALAGLVIAGGASPFTLALGAMGVSIVAFTSFALGGSDRRNTGSILFEMMVASACVAVSAMGGVGFLTSMQFGVGLLACVAGGVIIANCFEKSSIKDVTTSTTLFEAPFSPLRIVDKVIGLGRDLTTGAKTLLTYVTHRKNYSSKIQEQTDAKALCVMLTGLMGPASIFDDYHDEFSELEGQNITLFQPHVPKWGNCSLEDAVSGIYSEVASWATNNPAKPIVLIGVSNGARMSGYISSKLKEEGKTNPVHASCISGPFNGSKLINHPDWPTFLQKGWNKMFKIFFNDKVHEELSWDSGCSEQVVEGMRTAANSNVHYDFYSTSSDTQITPFTSAFPRNVIGANYFSTFAEGHISVVRAVKDQIIERTIAAISQS